jgi:hypothetical protein
LYQGSPLTLATPQVTASNTGAYQFPNVAGAFTVIALNSTSTQVGIATGQVQSLATVTQNVALSGTGQVTVNVFDSNGTPVPNANVKLSLTSFTVPADLTSTLTAAAVANTSGVAVFSAFFAGTLYVAASDPVTNHGGTAAGVVTAGGSAAIPLYFNFNEATANILSVQNGTVPGAVPPPGTNETPFRIFSVLNGATPGSTLPAGTNETPFWIFSVLNGATPGSILPAGTNETPFWIFSVLNGATPGSTLPAGTNETPFRIFSVLNGVVPGSVIPAGSNESVFPIFAVGNSTSNSANAIVSSNAVGPTGGSSGLSSPARVILSADRVSAGQTIQIAAALDTPSPGTTVEFFINGESFGAYAAPYRFALTVPYTVSSLRVTAVTQAPNGVRASSHEAAMTVTPESGLRLRGRIPAADDVPVHPTTVSLLYSGWRAELFHFSAPLSEMPDLTGLKPVAERAVSALDLRNPNGVFGKDPLATGLAPDYAIRFSAQLSVGQEGDYVFSLRGQAGVLLRIGGQTVTDGGKVHLEKGSAPVEALVFVGAGPMEIQLLWQPPDQPMQAIPDGVLWSREPASQTVTDLGGEFEFTAVPSSLGLIKVVTDGAASEPTPAAARDIGVLTARKPNQ